jgi:ligand-binding sensor domain-containing protein
MKNLTRQKHLSNFLRFLVLIGILIFVFPQVIDAQIKNIRFKHLTINDGLSHSWVHSIIQDKYGFIWIGTDDGLNRYDGYNFRVYKNNYRDDYSISSSNVMVMLEDSKGDLWIGTRQGLNLYDRKNERFFRYTRWSERITSVAEDKDENLWVDTNVELYYNIIKNNSTNIFSADSIWGKDQRDYGVSAILIDSRNNVLLCLYQWFFNWNRRLYITNTMNECKRKRRIKDGQK